MMARQSRWLILIVSLALAAGGKAADEQTSSYQQRVSMVRGISGLAAFWDFVLREDGVHGNGRFLAYTAPGDNHRYVLEPHNLSWNFWGEGRPAGLADFPLLGRGPFGEAVRFRAPTADDLSQLPVLAVPRAQLHDTPLDIKGPGRSVSMVAWLIYQDGNHAIAGLWQEGTLTARGKPAVVQAKGSRQFALFAGMGGNPGAAGAHLSENGLGSFGDDYARHLAVTPDKMKSVPLEADGAALDAGWTMVGFSFDAERQVVTAYLDGVAEERWVGTPAKDRFYRAAERAWRQAQLAKIPGRQEGEDVTFPRDQFYDPPAERPVRQEVLADSPSERTVLRVYEFTQVRATFPKNSDGSLIDAPVKLELVALKTNPYWFGHPIHSPAAVADGAPFTIGRVLHSGRGGKLTAYIGGVAVYGRALSSDDMQRLAWFTDGRCGGLLLKRELDEKSDRSEPLPTSASRVTR